MKITVTAEKPQDDQMAAKVTIAAKDVDAAIDEAYKGISHKYNFQGFRRGHAPRPVIDGIVGREAVLAEATSHLVDAAEPIMLEELDVVPVAEPTYGEKPDLVEGGADYVLNASIKLRPQCELDSYDAPEISMPPAEATEAEIDEQIDVLQGYHTSYEDVEEDRAVAEGDILSVDIEDVKGAEGLAGKNRMLSLDGKGLPEEFDKQLVGMKRGDTKEISYSYGAEGDDETEAGEAVCKVTVNAIKKSVVPELTDDFIKKGYGFDSLEEFRDAVKQEIDGDKKSRLPGIKEDRLVDALAAHLQLEEVPKEYGGQVFNELAQSFLGQLQRQGMTLDNFLKVRHIDADSFMADLQRQADERARQSLALDALARKLDIEATAEDVEKEFEDAGVPDVGAALEQFRSEGRMPAIRDSIRRSKALAWLTENATVNEVDEIAEKRAGDDAPATEEPTDKKTTTNEASAKKDAPKDEK